MCGFALPCLKIFILLLIIIIINYCTKHKRQCWKVLRRRRPRASRTEHRSTRTAQVLVPQVRQWSRPEKWGPRWIIQCPRCAWVSETRGLPPTGVRRWVEGKAPASFIPKLYPEVSPASRSIFGTSSPEESGSVGTRGKIGETTLRPRGRGRADSRAVSARGPGGEGARQRCAEAPRRAPGLAPRPRGPAPHSALRRRSGLGAGGAELGKASLLPPGLCGPASPRRARQERGHNAGQASAEPARSPAARLQPGRSRETPRGG